MPPDAREKRGLSLRKFIVEEYSSVKMAAETARVYEAVLAKGKAKAKE